MFHFFKQKEKPGQVVTFKIEGMHCSSCSINIDGELEDTPGVFEANSNFARAVSTVRYDPEKISIEDIVTTIKKLGYTMVETKK